MRVGADVLNPDKAVYFDNIEVDSDCNSYIVNNDESDNWGKIFLINYQNIFWSYFIKFYIINFFLILLYHNLINKIL